MKKLLVFIFLSFSFFLFVPQSFAAENWVINNYQSAINIRQDGKVDVLETIDVDFGLLSKHGIYRDIPNIYYSDNNVPIYSTLQIESVTRDGAKEQYSESQNGNFLRLQIGNPNYTFSGKTEYKIEYLMGGVLRSFSDHDELYLDITGNGWVVPIEKVDSTVTLPKDGITGVICYQGAFGLNEQCSAAITSQSSASFSTNRELLDGEGMTIVLGFKKGMVPIISVSKPQTDTQNPKYVLLLAGANVVGFFLILIFGVGIPLYLFFKKGCDQKGNLSNTVIVEYSAPDNLRPAEVGTLIDERADTLDVSATIVDLAGRGFLTIKEIDKKWLFGSTDYELDKKTKDTSALLDYEKILLDKLFEDGDSVKMSSLQTKFYKKLADVKTALYKDVVDKKYFDQNPESVRHKYLGIGVVIIIVGAVLCGVLFFLVGIGIALIISGAMFLIVSFYMPRKTLLGYETYLKIKGYKEFIDKAETYRQRFFEKENLFNEVLPYAIVFGDTEKFAKAFEKMGLKPAQPNWYYGSRPFNAVLFSTSINNFSRSMTSAIASTPHRNSFASGGSGFSGGFSGGGFGGGGGGSW